MDYSKIDIEQVNKELDYFCIDLKCFYASVECVERGLDPFKTCLAVADEERGKGAICLAISPRLKEFGVKNRCRLFEIPKNLNCIIAKPRMKKYIEYSSMIYSIYLSFFSPDDIHVYSIDEAFIYAKPYQKLYKKTTYELARDVMRKVYKETGIFATAGLGSNLYLAKVAMDIMAKRTKDGIAMLNEELYKKELWQHLPLTDFWNVGHGISNRLNRLGLYTMEDVAKCDEKILYKEFGVNAEYLIDHAKGIEPITIKEIKEYVPKSQSISSGQTLDRDYSYEEGLLAFKETVELGVLELVSKHVVTNNVAFSVGYSTPNVSALDYRNQEGVHASKKIDVMTNSYEIISHELLEMFIKKVDKNRMIRRINIAFGNIQNEKYESYNLFSDIEKLQKEKALQETIVELKDKYGKSSILRGMNLDPSATTLKRNKLVGGHNGE